MELVLSFWGWLTELFGSKGFRGFLIMTGVVVAIASVISARNTARKKQTADLLFGTRSDEKLSDGYKCLQRLHNSDDANMRALTKEDKKNSEDANQIRYVLNHWERVFVGLRQGIYDEKMLREANYNTVIKTFNQARAYIEAVRELEQRPTYYQCLERAAKRWKRKPLAVLKK
ncbi:DUF4760 domain-containing protein [Pseudomonas sp. MSSRFD41]|uniref:DUF4760 domain-containing protein n=1 Tax=Pseudomonas sp. MSSRFD41 TaxID=1310370 RepID=UPI00163A0920|nr:DUF4760 domain-containing protein [Pseudomonas sp. MSSRFD41]MBC2659781.1 DUF4760 domain-containing protein [Pseudomonas sp. MSSRFD41]